MQLIITRESEQSVAKPPSITQFIHQRQDVLTDGSTTLQHRRLSLTKQLRFVSGEHSGIIQTLNVTQSAALHLMPLCKHNQDSTMLMRLCCFHVVVIVVVVFLEKATAVRKKMNPNISNPTRMKKNKSTQK